MQTLSVIQNRKLFTDDNSSLTLFLSTEINAINFTSMNNMLMANAEGRMWQEMKQWILRYPLHLTGEHTCICDSKA